MEIRERAIPAKGTKGVVAKRRSVPGRTLSMAAFGASGRSQMAGEDQLEATASYFSGNDPKAWVIGAPTYAKVTYRKIYPGVDLSFYGKESRLEYDFLLRPNANPRAIELAMEGADDARVDESGDLILEVGGKNFRLLKPVAYQPEKSGAGRQSVEVEYQLQATRKRGKVLVGFALGRYDHSRKLVIDPILDYGTYLSSNDSYTTGIAADAAGNTYVLSEEGSNAAYQYPGFTVLKFDPNGNLLLSGTVLTSGSDAVPTAIAVSSTGAVYVTGYADTGLPTTANAYQAANPNNTPGNYLNAFIAVLQPNGSAKAPALVPSYISYLGGTYAGNSGNGNDYASAVAVDTHGDAYITGITGGEVFPTTTGAYQTTYPSGASSAGFVAKFDPSKSGAASLVYSTLLGSTSDYEYGIAVDSSGDAYVTGTDTSGTIPTTSGAFAYSGYGTGASIHVTKLNPTGTALVYSAALGPGKATAIALDGSNDVYITGNTTTEDFPTTTGAYQTAFPGAFASELNPAGTALIYSTFLGGPSSATNYSLVQPLSIALPAGCASACSAYVAGITSASDLPTINAVQGYQGANPTGFVIELSGTGTSALYSTYLGGVTDTTIQGPLYEQSYSALTPAVAADSAGNAYVTGNLSGTMDFPVTPNPVEPTGTLENVYLAKIGPGAGSGLVAAPSSVTFPTTIVNVSSTIYPGGMQPTVTLLNTGSSALTLSSIVTSPSNEFFESDNCNGSIAAGSSCVMTLSFTPEMIGTVTGTVTIKSTASATPVVVSLAGPGSNQGFVQFSPNTLNFADQVVSTTSAAQTATVTNLGHTAVTGFMPNASNSSVGNAIFPNVNNCPAQLDPGQSCQISVQFAPTATGLSASVIQSDSNGANLAVSGTGIAAGTGGSGSSIVWPGTINFGSLLVNTATSSPLYFTNTSASAPVTVNATTVALTSSVGSVRDFSVSSCAALPYSVSTGSDCTLTVNFTPSVAGTETATITVTDSSGSSPHTVTVTGTGLAATQVLEFTPGNQVFVDQPVGYQSAAQSFNVYNTGTGPVTIDRTLVTGDFQIVYDGCSGYTLAPPAEPGLIGGVQCSVGVAFTPTATGARTGTLSLIVGAIGTPQVLSLSGNGIAVTGSLLVSPTSATFPSTPVGLTTTTQQIALQNPGDSPITINSATATGDFSLSEYNCPAFPFPLTAAGTCSVSVAFTPTSSTTNPRTGTLTIAGSTGNQTVSLSGTGEVATQTVGLTPTAASFGSVPVGTTSDQYYIHLRNTGTEAVTFSAAATVTGDYAISYDPCTAAGAILAAGSDCAIQLAFTPTTTGARTGVFTLADSAGKQTVSITGTGTATTTAVAMNAEAVNFGLQAAGTTSGITQLLLRNYGSSQVVTIASLSITAGSQNFLLAPGYDECTGTVVQPGGYCYVYVEFAPTVSGYDTGTVTFVDSKGTKYTSALAGYSPADANSAYLSPTALGFGSQVVGTTSSNQTVNLYNSGNLPFTVGTVTGTNYSSTGTAPAEFAAYQNNSGYDGCSGTTVAPSSSCYIYVQFTPTASGGRSGNLVFPVTYSGATTAVNLTATLAGTGITGKNAAVLAPTSLIFPDQVVGTSSGNQVINLNNTGNLPLTVGAVTGTNYSATGTAPAEFAAYQNNSGYDACSGTTVAPGSSCYIYVQFTPTASGAQTGNLIFPVTYQGATKAVNFTATLSGKGVADVNTALLSPTSIAYPAQVVGTTSSNQPIYLTNKGNLPFTVGVVTGTNYSSSGAASAEFGTYQNNSGYDACSGTTVAPNSSCSIYLEFTPTASGSRTGSLVFPVTYSGASKAVNFTAPLSGTGVTVANAGSLSPISLSFGNQLVGTTSSYQGVTLNNTGNLPFTVGTVAGTNYASSGTAPAEFAAYQDNPGYDACSGTTVNPGGSCYIYVQFTPTTAGNRSGTLVFPVTYTGATKAVNFTESLSGVGVATSATLVLSQTSVAFGNQAVGTSSGQIGVSLTNYSANPLPVTSVVLSGTNAADFTESDSCANSTVTAGSSCTIFITFSPKASSVGARTAAITEKDPGTGGTRTITLTGTGTADVSAVSFYPTTTAFTTTETVNEGAPGKVVSLNYQGSVPLMVTSVKSSDATEFPIAQDGCTGQTVQSGGSCELVLAFSPAKTGALSATISVTDSATGSPQTFVVTGGGAAQATTTTTVVATPASAAFGSLFTFVATVKNGTAAVTDGSVTFYDGTKVLGTSQVVTTASGGATIGKATLKTLYLPLGANSITAKFAGAETSSTSAAATVTVTGTYPTTATLSSTGTQGSYVLVGSVAGGGPQTTLPTGKITFTDNQTSTTLGTVSLDPTTLAQSFVNSSTPAAGSNYPVAVTLADVNGDGKPDMLIGTDSLSGFLVQLGNGDGTYQTPQAVVGNSVVSNIVVADVNGDGKLDVIVSDGSAGVFLGNGDGTFQGEVDFDSSVQYVVLGDVNGDGKLDLVTSTSNSNYSVDVMLGNGDGTFQDPVIAGSGLGY